MSLENDDLMKTFVTEAHENLSGMDNDLLELESQPGGSDSNIINRVFRNVHSIKGAAGFLALTSINDLAHEMENVLNMMRNDKLSPDSHVIETLLRAADQLRALVQNAADSNTIDVSSHVEALVAIASGTAQSTSVQHTDREIDICLPNGNIAFPFVHASMLVARQQQGCCIYIIDVDLMNELDGGNTSPVDFVQQLSAAGDILDSYLSTPGLDSGTVSGVPGELRCVALVASQADSNTLSQTCGIPDTCVHRLAGPGDTDWQDMAVASGSADAAGADTIDTTAVDAVDSDAEITDSPTHTLYDAEDTNMKHNNASSPVNKMQDQESPSEASKSAPPTQTVFQDTNLRVNVRVLDTLMSLAGELVLGRNQLMQVVGTRDRRGLESAAGRMDHITTELQEAIMQTRMQPVGSVFNRFPRIVRDLSHTLGKECQLHIEGSDVELDKAILEAIADPLTHLVRNAVDHGIEMPTDRQELGKASKGTIILRALHQAGKVNISIEDDGGGIDADRLRAKAVEKGLYTEEQARELGEREALRLIFHPGLSTAEHITDVSGRGVGMDVVRTNIENLGGTVDVETTLGSGTTIHIRLPLTLAIIPSLVVCCGDQRYAIPQINISELVRIRSDDTDKKIDHIKNAEILRLRGSLLPLVRLSDVLSAYVDKDTLSAAEAVADEIRNASRLFTRDNDATTDPVDNNNDPGGDADDVTNIIVVESGRLRYGLVVDRLLDSEEIVVKPLGRHMKQCNYLAGATILGDGRVALIVDVSGIASLCDFTSVEQASTTGEEDAAHNSEDTQSMLLFRNDPSEQFAVPSSLISRIERIHSDQIDTVGGQEILQYRGTSLPLLSIDHYINANPRPVADGYYVVVFNIQNREIGMIAPTLQDIRNLEMNVDTRTFRQPGVMGSLVIDNKTTRLIDLFELACRAHPDWFEASVAENGDNEQVPRLLVVEDSDFFRSQVSSFLEEAGYHIDQAEDGQVGWDMIRNAPQPYDLIVTDIEMPNIDGIQLTRMVKASADHCDIPIIALTSLADDEHVKTGLDAGIEEYHIKLDRDAVLHSVANVLAGNSQRAAT